MGRNYLPVLAMYLVSACSPFNRPQNAKTYVQIDGDFPLYRNAVETLDERLKTAPSRADSARIEYQKFGIVSRMLGRYEIDGMPVEAVRDNFNAWFDTSRKELVVEYESGQSRNLVTIIVGADHREMTIRNRNDGKPVRKQVSIRR